MSKIQLLDCTLRDGGYINNFRFGKYAIRKILQQLTHAGLDIVECGFLEDGEYDEDTSIFNAAEQIASLLPNEHGRTMFVAMVCYGEYDLSQLSPCTRNSIDGIRVTFHYDEVEGALEYCREIKEKGYKVFVQPVGTSSYTDIQLLHLIEKVNELQPYSFYLVDTLGLMHKNDIARFFYLINTNLDKSINMGFHSHNNLQLSFSNSQEFFEYVGDRVISLDASIYGMGRGAGNLNTELIANYVNDREGHMYAIEPLLEVVDEFIIHIRQKHEWGYTVPYYLAAINGCHPNYASYLAQKQTLAVKEISAILNMIPVEKRSLYNKELVNRIYLEYQSHEVDDTYVLKNLKEKIGGRNIILMAPGGSITDCYDEIVQKQNSENCLLISVTFVPDFMDCDFTFLANAKRYATTFNPMKKEVSLIYTSNIRANQEQSGYCVNYVSLLNEVDIIRDNSALMALNLLQKLSPRKVYLAGMDGYSMKKGNYYQERLNLIQDRDYVLEMNKAIKHRISEIGKVMDIEFLTPSLYE